MEVFAWVGGCARADCLCQALIVSSSLPSTEVACPSLSLLLSYFIHSSDVGVILSFQLIHSQIKKKIQYFSPPVYCVQASLFQLTESLYLVSFYAGKCLLLKSWLSRASLSMLSELQVFQKMSAHAVEELHSELAVFCV